MMHHLNLTGKKAFVKIILDIVHADKLVSTGEFNYLGKIQKAINISDEELDDAQHLNAINCLVEIRDFSPEIKKEIVSILYEFIISDQDIDKNEVKTFLVICGGADIDIPLEISKSLGIH